MALNREHVIECYRSGHKWASKRGKVSPLDEALAFAETQRAVRDLASQIHFPSGEVRKEYKALEAAIKRGDGSDRERLRRILEYWPRSAPLIYAANGSRDADIRISEERVLEDANLILFDEDICPVDWAKLWGATETGCESITEWVQNALTWIPKGKPGRKDSVIRNIATKLWPTYDHHTGVRQHLPGYPKQGERAYTPLVDLICLVADVLGTDCTRATARKFVCVNPKKTSRTRHSKSGALANPDARRIDLSGDGFKNIQLPTNR